MQHDRKWYVNDGTLIFATSAALRLCVKPNN